MKIPRHDHLPLPPGSASVSPAPRAAETAALPGIPRRDWISLPAIIALALMLRLAVVVILRGRLSQDIDAYLGIAAQLIRGNGLAEPLTGAPTAFRPPLYPLLIAAVGGGGLVLGLVQAVLGTATVALTWLLGRRLQLGAAAAVAALLVAVDPLLVQYTALPMTETLSTFLTTALLVLLVIARRAGVPACSSIANSGPNPHSSTSGDTCATEECTGPSPMPGQALLVGIMFGLNVLCRPTLWAFGVLMLAWWLVRWWFADRRHRTPSPNDEALCLSPPLDKGGPGGVTSASQISGAQPTPPNPPLSRGGTKAPKQRTGQSWPMAWWADWLAIGLLLVIAPWGVRNLIVFQRPILTTTHGGYTLLLGNNPIFYREVVARPWGTVWSSESLEAWKTSLETAMQREGITGEVARDRWMSRRAWRNIAGQPAMFLRACGRRFLSFWNVAPLGPATEPLRRLIERFGGADATTEWGVAVVRWGVGVFYGIVTIGFVLGLFRLRREEWPRWMPLVLLVVSFTAVHLLYWTNTRMRAPVVPAIALLAVRGVLLSPRAIR